MIAVEQIVWNSSLREEILRGTVALTVVDHCGEVVILVEHSVLVRGNADLLQFVDPVPPLSSGLHIGDHVVVELQVRQALMGRGHGVCIHLRQQIRVVLVHTRHQTSPRISNFDEITFLYDIRRTDGIV